MFVLLSISHATLNSLENARPHLPEAIRQGEGMLWRDSRGYIQAGLKVDVPTYEQLQAVKNVSKAMGSNVLVFVNTNRGIARILEGSGLPIMEGLWFKLSKGEQPKGVVYFLNGSYYQVRA